MVLLGGLTAIAWTAKQTDTAQILHRGPAAGLTLAASKAGAGTVLYSGRTARRPTTLCHSLIDTDLPATVDQKRP